ncbi:snurportin-1-like [Amphiura filiformis]|uniref:snurportin-1-like n=1 Tax=Amphiura filiformis TaxID=82378 RepID=UPI003B20D2AC
MDDLAAAFSGAFNVTNTPNNTAAEHPRLTQYKLKSDKGSQEERRRIHLENQKKKRQDFANHARRLAADDWKGLEDDVEEEKEDKDTTEKMESTTTRPRSRRRHRDKNYYKDQLMMSEWLVDIPIDLSMEWVMVLCPTGKRTLVIASQGKTVVYNKGGYFINTFPSHLPGGASKDRRRSVDDRYTILDCIYSEVTRTFFVLDIMCWNGHPIYDSETEFRFYWLHTKFSEEPRLASQSKLNPFMFVPLPSCPCDASSLAETMSKPLPFQVPLDGVLFYHKRTHYTLGSTPLVGWLKPWMLPDMLGVPVPESIIANKPPGAKLRPPSPNDMDTDNAGKKTQGNKKDKPNRTKQHSGGKKGGKGDRKSGRHSMDTEEPVDQVKSPVFKFDPSSSKQQNGNSLKEDKKEVMDGVG